VRDPAHYEFLCGVLEPVDVGEDEREIAEQYCVLELRERCVVLVHEQRVTGCQRRDELGIDREIVLRRMTAGAGTAIAIEGLVHEERSTGLDQRRQRLPSVLVPDCWLRDEVGEPLTRLGVVDPLEEAR